MTPTDVVNRFAKACNERDKDKAAVIPLGDWIKEAMDEAKAEGYRLGFEAGRVQATDTGESTVGEAIRDLAGSLSRTPGGSASDVSGKREETNE